MCSFFPLDISSEVLKKILSYFRVLPGFIDVFRTFGEKLDEENEDFSVYREHITEAQSYGGPTYLVSRS